MTISIVIKIEMERVEQLEKQVKKLQKQVEKLQKCVNDMTKVNSPLSTTPSSPKQEIYYNSSEEQIYYNSSHMPGWEDS